MLTRAKHALYMVPFRGLPHERIPKEIKALVHLVKIKIWKFWVDVDVFNSTRSIDLNPNQKNRNRIRIVLQKYPNGTYELTILDFGYNPNRTEIRIRIRRYPKLIKYVNIFIYIKVI